MYVCLCKGVTDRDVQTAIKAGARNLRDLSVQLGIARDCGQCARVSKQLLREAQPHTASPIRVWIPAAGGSAPAASA
ncbi:MAG: (2Fe-2S)-binding protein [Pseudomonadota bacterium]|nr:(2Fe-2S)-binding protein [Pseudomonadota bacterium]